MNRLANSKSQFLLFGDTSTLTNKQVVCVGLIILLFFTRESRHLDQPIIWVFGVNVLYSPGSTTNNFKSILGSTREHCLSVIYFSILVIMLQIIQGSCNLGMDLSVNACKYKCQHQTCHFIFKVKVIWVSLIDDSYPKKKTWLIDKLFLFQKNRVIIKRTDKSSVLHRTIYDPRTSLAGGIREQRAI